MGTVRIQVELRLMQVSTQTTCKKALRVVFNCGPRALRMLRFERLRCRMITNDLAAGHGTRLFLKPDMWLGGFAVALSDLDPSYFATEAGVSCRKHYVITRNISTLGSKGFLVNTFRSVAWLSISSLSYKRLCIAVSGIHNISLLDIVPPSHENGYDQANYPSDPGSLVSSFYLRSFRHPSSEEAVPHRIRFLSLSQSI